MADKAWAGPNPPLFFFRRMFRHLLLLFPVLCLSSASPTWTVKDGDSTCLIIQADITGEIHWILKNSSFTFPWKFNNTIGTTGSCNAKTASSGLKANTLTVDFLPADEHPKAIYSQKWMLTLTLAQYDNKSYYLDDWTLTFTQRDGLNFTSTYHKDENAKVDFESYGKNGFKCTNVGLSLEFGSFMTLGNLRAVAFADIKGDDFPKQQVYEVCELDSRTSDVVPIIVGAALACLVVVVLVAYLVGRHRARTLGYGSV